MTEIRKIAVVLSGGGARGAYEVGVLKALHERDISPEIFCGTSVGSFNCALTVAGKELRDIEEIWLSLTAAGVFKLRLDPRQLLSLDPRPPFRLAFQSARVLGGILNEALRTRSKWWQVVDLDEFLLDTSPLARLIRSSIDLDALHRSEKEICIALTRLKPVDSDPLEIVKGKDITHDHVLASCSLPFVFPQVQIGDRTYCDGGVVMNSPLKPAIDAGAEEIFVVDLTPPPRTFEHATLPLAYQVLSAGYSAALNSDIKAAEELNSMYLAAHLKGHLVEDRLQITRLSPSAGGEPVMASRRYKYIRIIVIRPAPDPRGIASFLDFDPVGARALIRQGQQDTSDVLSRLYEKELSAPDGTRKVALFKR